MNLTLLALFSPSTHSLEALMCMSAKADHYTSNRIFYLSYQLGIFVSLLIFQCGIE
uniref:Uncharacterized protein n=1 Tax=Anguilla anguilla TaxID=7936 RepID=A0A0E9WUW6_ANGAN